MSSDTSMTVRLPSAVKDAYVLAANVKGMTLSAYVVEVLSDHAVGLGLVQPSPSGQLLSSMATDAFVGRQIHDGLVHTYRLSLERGAIPAVARGHVDVELEAYAKRGFVLSEEDRVTLESRLSD